MTHDTKATRLADEAKRLADEYANEKRVYSAPDKYESAMIAETRTELHAAIDALRDLAIPAGEAVAWRVSHPVSGDIFRDTEPDSGVYPPSYTVTPLYASPQPTPQASQDVIINDSVARDRAEKLTSGRELGERIGLLRASQDGGRATVDITLTADETSFLRAFMGEDEGECPNAIRLQLGDGHDGFGLYVSLAEHPEEGSSLLTSRAALRSPLPGRESTAQAGAGEDFPWPTMPPSRGQSHVLFEDGYAEGWAKCLDQCKEALHGAHQGSQGIIKGLTDYIAEKEAAAPNVLAMREALQGLLGACAKDGWWLKAEVVREMDAARAALASTLPEPRAGEAGDDVLLRFLCDLHANLPEAVRPMGWSDFSDEQAARARKAWARALAASPIATPKPQEREPLTVERIREIAEQHTSTGTVDGAHLFYRVPFARAIEAAQGIVPQDGDRGEGDHG